MGRRLIDDFRAGQVWTYTVVRGKCRYGPRHESVRMVGDEWWGEDTRSAECPYAPEDVCPTCTGAGFVEVSLSEAELAQYDGNVPASARQKRCETCKGDGFVPGPHWPYRHPHPGPLHKF